MPGKDPKLFPLLQGRALTPELAISHSPTFSIRGIV
jgi:hypothetical protein